MTARLNPYLNFRGTAREAMEFYRSVLGGKLTVSTFREYGMPVAEDDLDLVMHAQLVTEDGFWLMGADVPSHMEWTPGAGAFSVSLSGDESDRLSGIWSGLAEGATITAPFELAPWGDTFGMLTDRYGVDWLVNVTTTAID